MIVCIPVKCQNGHKATWRIEVKGLETIPRGVTDEENCPCPKFDFGEGWRAAGDPYVEGMVPVEVAEEIYELWMSEGEDGFENQSIAARHLLGEAIAKAKGA